MSDSPDSGEGSPADHPGSGRFRPPPPERTQRYHAPPRIRTTGEVPAVTGEVPADAVSRPDRPMPSADLLGDPGSWPPAGSVVDRPAPTPPDWMSGVQVPELLVTRDIDRSELAVVDEKPSVGQIVQRIAGLVLVAILVAVVVLVLVGSVTGLGSGLR